MSFFLQPLDLLCVDVGAADVVARFREARADDEPDVAGTNDGDIHELARVSRCLRRTSRRRERYDPALPLREPGRRVARVDDDTRVIHDALIVDRGVIGDDHDRIGAGNLLVRERRRSRARGRLPGTSATYGS